MDKFCEIASIVGNSYSQDHFKGALLLVYDVLMRKEQERKAPELSYTSANRDGLEVMNFLFDLINHISGYTEKYFEEHFDKISHEDLIQKYRAEKTKYEHKINDSPLLGDRYPHSVLVLEGVQELFKMVDGNG